MWRLLESKSVLLLFLSLTGSAAAELVAKDSAFTVAEGATHAGVVSATGGGGGVLTFALASGPAVGSLVFNADGNFTYQAFRQPTVGFVETDSFTFTANDGEVNSNIATVTVTIIPVNDPPVANDGTFTVLEGSVHNGLVSGTDVDGDPLTFSLVSAPALGTLVFNADGSFIYQAFRQPTIGFVETDSFEFVANDGLINSDEATVMVTIVPVNDAPVAHDKAFAVDEGTVYSGMVSASDIDGDALSFFLVSGPSYGTLTLYADGNFDYQPAAGSDGTDSFMFAANDGLANSNLATVSITIMLDHLFADRFEQQTPRKE